MLGLLTQSLRAVAWKNSTYPLSRDIPAIIHGTRTYYNLPKQTMPYKDNSWSFLSNQLQETVKEATSIAQEPEVVWDKREKDHVRHLPPPPDAYSGRSLYVGKDLGVTFNLLQRTLRQNNVTRELRMAERHEKKGVKRRRLSSQRWRRRFAHEVRKKVQLVNEIRARGA